MSGLARRVVIRHICPICRQWRTGIGEAERLGNHRIADTARDGYLAHRRRAHGYQIPEGVEA